MSENELYVRSEIWSMCELNRTLTQMNLLMENKKLSSEETGVIKTAINAIGLIKIVLDMIDHSCKSSHQEVNKFYAKNYRGVYAEKARVYGEYAYGLIEALWKADLIDAAEEDRFFDDADRLMKPDIE